MDSAVLRWPIVAWDKEASLPSAILTERPAIVSPAVPVEIGLMLPAKAGREGLPTGPEIPNDENGGALGLFLSSPFLNLDRIIPRLQAASMRCVSNFPTVGFQDPEFARQLSDVGFDPGLELRKAKCLIEAGFDWLAVVADPAYAEVFLDAGPTAVLAMPNLRDFTAGFPSPRVRTELATTILNVAKSRNIDLPVLGYGQAEEAERSSLWPKGVAGLVVRPPV